VLNEWTLELAHKEIRKLTHENPCGTPALDVSAENQKSQRRDGDGGAKPYACAVDIQAPLKGDHSRSNDILDCARRIG
jgi:hypothetical protein